MSKECWDCKFFEYDESWDGEDESIMSYCTLTGEDVDIWEDMPPEWCPL